MRRLEQWFLVHQQGASNGILGAEVGEAEVVMAVVQDQDQDQQEAVFFLCGLLPEAEHSVRAYLQYLLLLPVRATLHLRGRW